MQQITRNESDYLRIHCPSAFIVTTCKEKSKAKRKKRNVEETIETKRLLKEYNDSLIILERHGWFEEEYRDKNGKIRTRTVYYK